MRELADCPSLELGLFACDPIDVSATALFGRPVVLPHLFVLILFAFQETTGFGLDGGSRLSSKLVQDMAPQ